MEKLVCLFDKIRSFRYLYTVMRDRNSDRAAFVNSASRIMSIICEESLCFLDSSSTTTTSTTTIVTPTGSEVAGVSRDLSSAVAVSIIRAGDSMLDTFLSHAPQAKVGKILIQRNEETAEPMLYYSKLPDVAGKKIFLLDPMLATGGSAIQAIQCLIDKGATPANIIFVNVVACPEGIGNMQKTYPEISIITGCIDECLNEKKYIIPGLGDFGDRFFGTC